MTQKQAEYQDEPKGGIMMCGTCTLFIPPAECKVVEGYRSAGKRHPASGCTNCPCSIVAMDPARAEQ